MSGPVPDLLPCPFCGGEAHAPKAIGGHSSAFRIVQCSRSDSCGSVAGSTDAEAIAAWNTRTDPERDALKARVDALVEALGELIGCTMGGKVAGGDGNTYAIYPPTAAALAKGQAALALAKGEAQ